MNDWGKNFLFFALGIAILWYVIAQNVSIERFSKSAGQVVESGKKAIKK